MRVRVDSRLSSAEGVSGADEVALGAERHLPPRQDLLAGVRVNASEMRGSTCIAKIWVAPASECVGFRVRWVCPVHDFTLSKPCASGERAPGFETWDLGCGGWRGERLAIIITIAEVIEQTSRKDSD